MKPLVYEAVTAGKHKAESGAFHEKEYVRNQPGSRNSAISASLAALISRIDGEA